MSEVLDLFKDLDSRSHDNRLDFEEARGFLRQNLESLGSEVGEEHERAIFDWIDKDHSRDLSLSELADFLLSMNASNLNLRVQRTFELGCIRLLSARWLLSQPETFRIMRRQDLPDEAFLDPGLSSYLFCDGHFDVIVLSYGWISKEHPDPSRFHLRRLLQYLRAYMEYAGAGRKDVGIFWDFASLPQQPRTDRDDLLFRMGLRGINILYGSPTTVVLQLTDMPPDGGLVSYSSRGWCTFEEVVACIMKDARKVLNLGLAAGALDEGKPWKHIRDRAIAERRAPLHPTDMATVLEEKRFTNRADKAIVCRIYQDFFFSVCNGIDRLNFEKVGAGAGWDMAEVGRLSKALKEFAACQVLRLCNHPIGNESLAILLDVFEAMPALRTLDLDGCDFGAQGLQALRDQLDRIAGLWIVRLPGRLEESEEGLKLEQMAGALREVNASKGPRIEWAHDGC